MTSPLNIPYNLGLISALSLSGLLEEREDIQMALLTRKYKLATGQVKEDRITEQDRIDRYMGMLGRETAKQLNEGKKVTVDKDEWQFTP